MKPCHTSIALLACTAIALAGQIPTIPYRDQFGTPGLDTPNGVAIAPDGKLWVSGGTGGELYAPSQGDSDVFIRRYDSCDLPTPVPGLQFGNATREVTRHHTSDQNSYCYTAFYTGDDVEGFEHAGDQDSYLDIYAPGTPLERIRRISLSTDRHDHVNNVSPVNNGVVACGHSSGYLGGPPVNGTTLDGVVLEFDTTSGSPTEWKWSDQFSLHGDTRAITCAETTDGHLYVGGFASSPGYDRNVFVRKYGQLAYDPIDGFTRPLLWTKEYGNTGYEEGGEVVVDSQGNAYIIGHTSPDYSSFTAGEADGFIWKVSSDDNFDGIVPKEEAEVWDIVSAGEDVVSCLAIDDADNLWVAGRTTGELFPAHPEWGPTDVATSDRDAFVAKYLPDGTLVWGTLIGTQAEDRMTGLTIVGDCVAMCGFTRGDLFAPNAGSTDGFVMVIPEPGTLSLLALGGIAVFRKRT